MSAEEAVFCIPELRRYILGFYLDKKIVQRKVPKKCKDKVKKAAITIATPPLQCCCVLYICSWVLYKTRCCYNMAFVRL